MSSKNEKLVLGQTVKFKANGCDREWRLLAFVPAGVSLQKDGAFRHATGEDLLRVGKRLTGDTIHQRAARYLVEVAPEGAGRGPRYYLPLAGVVEREMNAAPFGSDRIAFVRKGEVAA